MANKRYNSPVGEGLHLWLDKPDTKFDNDGDFKGKLIVDLNETVTVGDKTVNPGQVFKDLVDAEAQKAFDEELKDLSVKARKDWRLFVPYKEELDADENPTGRIIFEFKRNAVITIRKTQERKNLTVAFYDSANKPIPKTAVFSGATIRFGGIEFRPIKVTASQKAGVRMDFSKVQILKLAERSSGFADESDKYGRQDWNNEAGDDDKPFDGANDQAGGDY